MDDETFNMSLRKYLKRVGVTSQQAIERHVREHGELSVELYETHVAAEEVDHLAQIARLR